MPNTRTATASSRGGGGCEVFLTETAGGLGLWDAAEHALQSFAVWEYKAFCREDNATLASPSQSRENRTQIESKC